MTGDAPTHAPAGSRAALVVLVTLVVLSPWPFGSVHLRTTQAIAVVSLATALGAFLWDGRQGPVQLPTRGLMWPLVGLWLLAVFQLLPLPEGFHRWLAPGSAAVWYPDVPAAAAVLGPGPHPISLHPDATRRWLAFATGVIALALAAAPAFRERRVLLRTSVAIVTGGVLVAVYGFVAPLFLAGRLYGVWSVPTVAPFGPFVSKNHFAGYVELGALLAVGLATGLADEARHGENWLSWIDSRRGKWIVVAWAAALVLVLAVPVSLSRGGVVSLAAGLACFALLRVLSRRRSRLSGSGLVGVLAALGAAGLLVVAVLPAEARQRMLTLAGITNDQSGSYRLALWGDTLRVVASSPVVGSGFGAYEDALPRFKTAAAGFRVQHAENDHLEFLAEGGLLAAGLGAAAVLALLFLGLGTLPATEHRLARSLLTAAFAAGATAFVHAVFDFNLHIPSNTLVASLVAALSVSATHRRAESATTSRRSPGSTMALLVLTGSFLCALVTPWADPWWEQSRLRRARTSGEADLRRASLETDVAGLLHRRPARAEAWVQLGWLRLLGSRVPDSAEDAKGLARWGVVLDPTHSLLGHAATPIGISVPPSYPR